MNVLVPAARVFLAIVFATAGVAKLADLGALRRTLDEFGVPARAVRLAASALVLAELAVAAALAVSPSASVGAAGALALLAVFVTGVLVAMTGGQAPECNCFGQLHSEPVGVATLGRNAVLAGVAILILVGGGGAALGGGGLSGDQQALVGLLAGMALLVMALVQLAGENRRLRGTGPRRPGASQAAGLAPGTDAPDFTLAAAPAGTVSLEDLRGAGRRVILVFVSTHCGPCLQLLGPLGQWQPALADRVTLAVLFSGSPAEVRALSAEHQLDRVLIQDEDEVFSRYGLRATPSAVVIAADGTVGAPAAEGQPAIESLIRVLLAQTDGEQYSETLSLRP